VAWKLLLAGTIVVALAGCGESGHVRRSPPPTKAGFAAAANHVCRTTRTHRGRLAGLRGLAPKVPVDELDLYRQWLGAERLAIDARDVLGGRKKQGIEDPLVALAVAQGKIAGYSRRMGARMCAGAPGVTMPS
jgi:hypothetical protein